MTLKSMTGFARADGVHGDTSWHWEVRRVNGRNLDMRLRLPPVFEADEAHARSGRAPPSPGGGVAGARWDGTRPCPLRYAGRHAWGGRSDVRRGELGPT